MTFRLLWLALPGLLATGCAAPTVRLATAEPIKMDINVRLDVYQHNPPAAKTAAPSPTPASPEASRRKRMGDIQNFKNQRLVGEGRDGLLAIRSTPEGTFGEYVRLGVEAENADRMALMKSLAETQKKPLPEVQTQQAEMWRTRSFAGEWIEVPQADGTWLWVQKSG
jgi:uncharacterized protein YdbL (DUF1318 family)